MPRYCLQPYSLWCKDQQTLQEVRYIQLRYGQAQEQRHGASWTDWAQQKVQEQRGFLAALKRFAILHSAKLTVLAAFWASAQHPGGLGWLITCMPYSLLLQHNKCASLVLFLESCD